MRPLTRPAWLTTRFIQIAAGLLLAAIDLRTYLRDPAHPGGKGRIWWGWWDQSHYLLSARSLAQGDFQAAHHWYPPGYAVLGAPFTALSSLHPFLLPDLCCLLATYMAFLRFAHAIGVAPAWSAPLFLLATCGSASIRAVWAVPWNTTLSSALIWWLLALMASRLVPAAPGGIDSPRRRRARRMATFVCIGALASLIPFTRPTDAVLVAICVIGGGFCLAWERLLRPADIVAVAAGATMLLVPEALLWLRIYGLHPSDYMLSSRALGFGFGSIGWRSYLLLQSPQPWFPYGEGIMHRLVWILPGLAGMLALPWITRGHARQLLGLLAAMIVAYSLTFFAYVDLIASGLWRYENIHYVKWVLPGLTLLGFVLLRALAAGPRRPALIATAAILLLFVLRVLPDRVGDRDPAWLIQVRGPSPVWETLYFGNLAIRDDRGSLATIRDFRAMPDNHGWRLIALSRPFAGVPVLSGLQGRPDGPVDAAHGATRWGRSVGVKLLPCWLVRCADGP